MADAWFSAVMPLTPSELKRRISVTTSSTYKNPKPGETPPIKPSGHTNDNREIFWARTSWFEGDELPDKYLTEKIKRMKEDT